VYASASGCACVCVRVCGSECVCTYTSANIRERLIIAWVLSGLSRSARSSKSYASGRVSLRLLSKSL